MLAHTRTLCRMARPMTTALSNRPFTVSATCMETREPERAEIELQTLALLQDYIMVNRAKSLAEPARFYQKIHKVGDLYHPEDLNDARYQDQIRQRRGRPVKPDQDPFEILDIDPLHEYKNVKLLSHFVSETGKILPRDQTGVSAKNQRKLAKAIKRARAMGFMSCTSKEQEPTF
ncbi:ribosomal protein S18 [Dichotomocladium elegans]|nr:ribosomal protein S18 [Dichotomocladium elegans]